MKAMYILEVIPLTNLPQNVTQVLSYFGDTALKKGAVVEVSVHSREVKAVVISSQPLEKKKLLLKKSEFQLKKINSVFSEEPLIGEKQFQIALWLSKYYFAPLTLCLKSILPAFLFLKKYKLILPSQAENQKLTQVSEKYEAQKTKPILILSNIKQLPQKLEPYLNEIIFNSRQVLILVPDKNEIKIFADYYKDKFKISEITSDLTNKQQFENWRNIALDESNQLIIGTRSALTLEYKNLGLIVVCDSLNDVYHSETSPKYFAPKLAEKISGLNDAKLIFADVAIGTENFYRAENRNLIVKNELPQSSPKIEIIDMTKEIRSGNFSIFSRELKDKLKQYIGQNKKILIFSSRKGYMGMYVCRNCGIHISCPNCDIPMRVHKAVDLYLFCHRCSTTKPLPKFCLNCSSGNMKPTGPAGSEKIFEEIRSMIDHAQIPYAPAVILDSEVTKNETEEEEIIEALNTMGAIICIATELIFSYRGYRKFDFAAIPNTGTLAHFFDFRAEEKFLYQLRKISDFEPAEIMLQTHDRNNELFNFVTEAFPVEFYKTELKLREMFKYPPFSRLVTLKFFHKDRQKTAAAAIILSEKLRQAAARLNALDKIIIGNSTTASITKEKGFYVCSIVLKILPSFENPRELLKYIPRGWLIEP